MSNSIVALRHILSALLLLALCSCNVNEDWKTYAISNENFSILMPAQPVKVEKAESNNKFYTIHTTQYLSHFGKKSEQQRAYLIMIENYVIADSIKKEFMEKFDTGRFREIYYKSQKEGLLEQYNATIVEDKELDDSNIKGRELMLLAKDGKRIIHERTYSTGYKFYVFLADIPTEPVENVKNAVTFIESFRFGVH